MPSGDEEDKVCEEESMEDDGVKSSLAPEVMIILSSDRMHQVALEICRKYPLMHSFGIFVYPT